MREWWREHGRIIAAFILAQMIIVAAVAAVGHYYPVQAAKPAPPTLTICVKVSEVTTQAGLLIEDFRCEDQDQGYIFYKNSLGFAWNREN